MNIESGVIWKPREKRIKESNLLKFLKFIKTKTKKKIINSSQLHDWSIAESDLFWKICWDFLGIISKKKSVKVTLNKEDLINTIWFPGAKLNFAENLLKKNNNDIAIHFWCENRIKLQMSWKELNVAVSRTQQALISIGIKKGDVIASVLPNNPDAVVFMLATTSLGGIWSSCSPDFGSRGILERFKQIKPKLLIAVDGYYYNGKKFNIINKIEKVSKSLKSLKKTIISKFIEKDCKINNIRNGIFLDKFVENFSERKIKFIHCSFNDPLYILFSSGTTGVPKCIIHRCGGTLIQHLKEHQLNVDIKPGDNFFYFTTCSWMMWNWLVSGLASEASITLYDGSPFYPRKSILFDLIDQTKINVFGTSAKFIDALKKNNIYPNRTHNLKSLQTIISTGSVLSEESYEFVYNHIKKDLLLSSSSGGTDIISCFVLGNPTLPVYKGELQQLGFGQDVKVFNDFGESIINKKGELVCTNSFPSMPIGFVNDPKKTKYKKSYFSKFNNIWCHGDYMKLTERKSSVIYGRSDTTLNPGGVRIGTAEIYRQVENFDFVEESIVVGQDWKDDVRIILFIKMKGKRKLTPAFKAKILQNIKKNTTQRHTPSKLIQVMDIPRTKSGKIVELAVKKVIQGEDVKNIESIANPNSLKLYKNLEELKS